MNKELEEAFGLIKRTCELYVQSALQLVGTDIIGNKINEALGTVQNNLESVDNANPSEALECLKALQGIRDKYSMPLTEYVNSFDYIKTIKQVLIKQQEQEKFFDDMLVFKNGCMMSCFGYKGKQIVAMPLEEYDEFMKQEKALEIIKEKNVNVKLLKLSTNLLDYYTRVKIKTGENTELTEEEYDLLKEVLG